MTSNRNMTSVSPSVPTPEVPPLLVEYLRQTYPIGLPTAANPTEVAHNVAFQLGVQSVINHLASVVEAQKEDGIAHVLQAAETT